jgi:hypothetical protein
MAELRKPFLRWIPRVGSLAFAVFIALFALDVFEEYEGLDLALALAIHLIPSALVLAVALAGWRWPSVGAIGFFLLAAAYVGVAGLGRPILWYVLISGPALLLATLFLLDAATNARGR